MTVPAAKLTVPCHTGLEEVYSSAERAMASAVFQLPSAATFPAILIVSPYVVVTLSSNVTATVEAVGVLVDDVVVVVVDPVLVDDVVVVVPPVGVWLGGQVPVDAVE